MGALQVDLHMTDTVKLFVSQLTLFFYFSPETFALIQKMITNTQKVVMIVCGGREAMLFIDDEISPSHLIKECDVRAGWDIIKQSIHVYSSFKVKLMTQNVSGKK